MLLDKERIIIWGLIIYLWYKGILSKLNIVSLGVDLKLLILKVSKYL